MNRLTQEFFAARRPAPRRRGSVIIFAVGVLVLLAVLAAVFLTSAQQQRDTGTATLTQHREQRSGAGAQRYMDHIVGIISRDVFDPMVPGGVAEGTPLVDGAPIAYELWDYPYTRANTVGTDEFNTGGDDPWLAEIDPRTFPLPALDALGRIEDAVSYDQSFGYWMNISKIHPRGTFVRIDRHNPTRYTPIDETTNPELATPLIPDGITSEGAGIFATPPTPALDREWADTDGNGHYDARWTRWEGMGDLPGMTTYIAVRIIDLSGMINVNTATSYSTGGVPDYAPVSAADVDLLRFFSIPDYANAFGSGLDPWTEGPLAFDRLMLALGYEDLPDESNNTLYAQGSQFLDWDARRAAYDIYQGRSEGISSMLLGAHWMSSRFSMDDELALRAYAGRKDPASTSRLERFGSDSLRASATDEIATRHDFDNVTSRVQQYMVDLRHRLTTMSKARRIGNQTNRFPTEMNLLTGEVEDFAYPLVNTKLPLPARYDVNQEIESPEFRQQLAKYFKAYAQALAPFAVSPLFGHETWFYNPGPNSGYALSYGWDMLVRSGAGSVSESTEQFAVRTSAQLALNLMDMFGGPAPPGMGHLDELNAPPRFVRLNYSSEDQNLQLVNPDRNPELTLDDLGMTGEPPNIDIDGEREVWLFGQKPHPFLAEAVSIVIYQDKPGGPPPDHGDDLSDEPDVVDPDRDFIPFIDPIVEPDEADPYKALYIELRNPYRDIALDLWQTGWPANMHQYEIRLGGNPIPVRGAYEVNGNESLQLGQFGFGGDFVILEVLNSKLSDDTAMRNDIREALGLADSAVVYTIAIDDIGDDFWADGYNQVELWRRLSDPNDNDAYLEFMLVDVMRAPAGSDPFPNDPVDIGAPFEVLDDAYMIGFESYLQRNADSAKDGLPSFLIERPEIGSLDGENYSHSFEPTTVHSRSRNDYRSFLEGNTHSELGKEQKRASAFTSLEPIQLFSMVGRTEDEHQQFFRVGDIGLVPTIGPMLLDASNPDVADSWLTVSEQLARTMRDQAGVSTPLYQFSGPETLQFTRSVVDGYAKDLSNPDPTPQIMPALPIALRVFDAFDFPVGTNRLDGLEDPNSEPALMQALSGQININTAPYEVLRMLPFVDNDLLPLFSNHDLAATIINYRDRRGALSPLPGAVSLGFWSDVGDPPYQNPPRHDMHGVLGARDEPGFTSIGELLMLIDEAGHSAGAIDFLASGANIDFPTYDLTEDNVANDAEEERLIFSALSNMVTVRSDTFCVYLRIRGYKTGDRLGTPSVDERWVAVIDRSNVVVPGDKARIVFMQRVE